MATDLPRRRLPLAVARQVLFWLRPAGEPSRFAPPELPIWPWETREGPVWSGFPDLGNGPKVARYHGGSTTTPEAVDRVVSEEGHAPLLAFLATAIPDLRGPVIETQVCLYTPARRTNTSCSTGIQTVPRSWSPVPAPGTGSSRAGHRGDPGRPGDGPGPGLRCGAIRPGTIRGCVSEDSLIPAAPLAMTAPGVRPAAAPRMVHAVGLRP